MKTYKMPTLGQFKRVENMTSSNGNDVPNQFDIDFEKGYAFQSYSSIIVVVKDGQTYIGQNWDYSTTTGKYRNQFLWETKKETQAKIDSWEYKMLKV